MSEHSGEIFDKKRQSPFWPQIQDGTLKITKRTGVRVAFVTCRYSIGESNPVIGSKYECLGTVHSSSNGGVQVHWDNKHSNSYQHDDLMLVRENNPNILFRLRKKKR